MTALAYLYQLQGTNYSYLNGADFTIGVVDYQDSGMSKSQVDSLESSGKTVFSYLSIGEAEPFRDYWKQRDWDSTPPDFLLDKNTVWGSQHVAYWDPEWQALTMSRIRDIVDSGYSGAYLDIVDAYTLDDVKNAYTGTSSPRQEMIDFVVKLSEYAKSLNPDFKIIPQNAVGLLNREENLNLNDPLDPNTRYLNAIDGVGKESTWTDGDTPVSWTRYDLHYLENATNAGKFVLAIDYPTTDALQQAFITHAIEAGFIPFIGTWLLDGQIDPTNYDILSRLPDALLAQFTADSPTSLSDTDMALLGTDSNDTLTSGNGNDMLMGYEGNDLLTSNGGNDSLQGNAGNDTLYGGAGNDLLQGGQQHDQLYGDADDDTLYGNLGNDTLQGGEGDDFLQGNQGSDILQGDAGDDTLLGGQQNDTLQGGAGEDQLSGNLGNDVLSGGSGNDRFVFERNAGNDTINDFEIGKDIILISSTLHASAQEASRHVSYADGNAVLELDSGNHITLLGVAPGEISVEQIAIF